MEEPGMSDNTYSFRTALGGFHRGDVSEYIASTAAANKARISDLQEQIDRLEQENEALRIQLEQAAAEAVEEASEKTAAEADIPEGNLEAQELAAYRRAEAVERLANLRARKLCDDMQEICDSSIREFQNSDEAARSAADSIYTQLDVIRWSRSFPPSAPLLKNFVRHHSFPRNHLRIRRRHDHGAEASHLRAESRHPGAAGRRPHSAQRHRVYFPGCRS